MLVSCMATLLRWKLQPVETLSVIQPLFQGCNFNLPKCWSVAQPPLRGGNYNLLKYCQLYSHSSKAVISICWNVDQMHSHPSEDEITTCQHAGQLHSHSPLAHHPTVGQLVITWTCPVGHPISPPTPLVVTWTWLLANPLAHQSHCWPTGNYLNLPCWLTH